MLLSLLVDKKLDLHDSDETKFVLFTIAVELLLLAEGVQDQAGDARGC